MPPDTIVCRPTPWFLFRAAVITLMFGVFAIFFYKDGSTGYREKNEMFYLRQTFREAAARFASMGGGDRLTPAEWRQFAEKQTVALPANRSVMPADSPRPYPWPAVLHDFEKMKPLQWEPMWIEYSGQRGLSDKVPDEPYDERKILEQWVVFWICLVLALAGAFLLIRTVLRRLEIDENGLKTVDGRHVPFSAMRILDLRKWQTKGLAFLTYEKETGTVRTRIDGLTYGGFNKEQGEPAEQLMNLLRSRFRGEIIEYAEVAAETKKPDEDV
ncbi:MAG: hypothetical protein V4733_09550 [Verrucomicrobiota bacterium]